MADDPLDRSRAYAAAGVLFSDNAHRILLVQPTYKDHWDIPGGYVETGETPVQAAAREVREELGIEAAVGPLLVALFVVVIAVAVVCAAVWERF